MFARRTPRSVPLVLGTVTAMILALAGGLTAVGAITGGGAASAATASGLVCDQNTIYGIDASGKLDSINVTTGATALVASVSPAFNAVGVTNNGIAAYQFDATDDKITKYDSSTGTVTTFNAVDPTAPNVIIRGAVDPATGIYYYGGSGTTAYLGAFNTNTDTAIGRIGTIAGKAIVNRR